jgi:hypothetical protein
MASRTPGARWGDVELEDDLNKAARVAMLDVSTYMVRTEDDNLRALVREVRDHSSACMLARTENESIQRLQQMGGSYARANERLGELLRALY